MRPQYHCRILTAISGVVIELVRFKRVLNAHDISSWIEGRERRVWVEHTMSSRRCITPRWQPPKSTYNSRDARSRLYARPGVNLEVA